MKITINNQEVFMDNKSSMRVEGWTFFASVMMLVYAALLVIAGFAGIFNGDAFFRSDSGQLLIFNFVTWGWIHLVIGVLMAISGGALIMGRAWARISGVLLVLVAILLNVLIVGAYPGWSLTFLIFDALLLITLMVPGSRDKV
jgi:hypothetical protein